MDHSKYITPRLGLRTALVLAFWFLQVPLFGILAAKPSSDHLSMILNPPDLILLSIHLASVGSIYGAFGWICWACANFDSMWIRWPLRFVAAMSGSYLAGVCMPGEWIEFLIYFCGMMISQSVIFFVLLVPPWKIPFANRETKKRQFTINDVLVGTTATALLLGAAIRFHTPVDPRLFWQVLIVIWIAFPILSAGECLGALHRCRRTAVAMVVGTWMLAATGSIAIGHLDARLNDVPSDAWTFSLLYGMIVAGNLLLVFGLTLAGRRDAVKSGLNLNGQQDGSSAKIV